MPEPDLRISHIAIDRAHTHAADNTYLPLTCLKQAAEKKEIGRWVHLYMVFHEPLTAYQS